MIHLFTNTILSTDLAGFILFLLGYFKHFHRLSGTFWEVKKDVAFAKNRYQFSSPFVCFLWPPLPPPLGRRRLWMFPNVFYNVNSHLQGEQEEANFIESQMGKLMLLDKNGHVFLKNNQSKHTGRIWWLCREHKKAKKGPKCLARATTQGKYVVRWGLEHNH